MINLEQYFTPASPFTSAEFKILELLSTQINHIYSREDIAKALWKNFWLQKYSDWEIDTQIYRIRKKIKPNWNIKNVRNRGYFLYTNRILSDVQDEKLDVLAPSTIIKPPPFYIEYMNNPKVPRRTLADLIKILNKVEILPDKNTFKKILVIDSYTLDNLDVISTWTPQSQIYFSHFDDRALEFNRQRTIEHGLTNITCIYDDIRQSRFRTSIFDLVINDFRLNFNLSHIQNQLSLSHISRILRPGGKAIISVVVDPRYESSRFGKNQEKAPLNKSSPGKFIGDENLSRLCFTVPYYKTLFSESRLQLIKEFDITAGKTFAKTQNNFHPQTALFYRRFLLQKQIITT